MKAIRIHQLGDRGSIRIDEVPAPSPGPGEIVVDTAVASVNFPDILMLDGKYQIRPELPFVPGKDGAGTVSAVGEGVDELTPGDRVLFYVHYGAFAEKIALPASRVFKLPAEVPFDAAAAMGMTFQTAWVALVERAKMKSGDVVLVTGAAGGVGLAAVSLAKALGADVVLAGLTTVSKAPAVRAAGADHIIDFAAGDLKDAVREQVKAATNGRAVDVVIDVVGAEVFDACLRTLGFCGRIVVLGFTGGRIPEAKTNYLLIKNISVHGSSINAYYENDLDAVRRGQERMFRLHGQGKLSPHIDRRFAFERFAEAIKAVEDRSVVGKILLEI